MEGAGNAGNASPRTPALPVVPAAGRKRRENAHAELVGAHIRVRFGTKRPPNDDAEVDHGDLQHHEHEDRFPHGVAHAGQFTPRAPLLLRTVANTTLILQPLGCPELSGHPALAASGDTCETYSPPRHRSVRARR